MAKIYKRIKGFHGPLHYPNGRVLYFDKTLEQYYDPLTDFYIGDDEVAMLQKSLFDVIAKEPENDQS